VISVILPALNEELGIEACLRSIARQNSSEDYEIIVVDGGSEDSTVSISLEYADKVVKQRSPGIGGARRDGAKIASGDKLAFTDADSIVSENWLMTVSSNLENYDASTGPVVYNNPGAKSELIQRWRSLYRLFYLSSFYYIIGSNMAVSMEIYNKIGGHSNISLLDDYDLSIKLFRNKAKARYDPNQVVYTSPRRAKKLLAYAFTVAYGHYHYRISKNQSRLLYYPKTEEMRLRDLIVSNSRGAKRLKSSLKVFHDSLQSILKE
jgi:glycosyltransferase involved in cell wall biosynthesis